MSGERWEEISADTGTETSGPILDTVSLPFLLIPRAATGQLQFEAPGQFVTLGRNQSGKT